MRPAQRGNRIAAWVMVGSRVVSVFLVDLTAIVLGAPGWVIAVVSIAILFTVLGIWWTAPLLGRTHAASRTAS